MKFTKYFNTFLIALITFGCTSKDPYPNTWPNVSEITGEDCSYLEGTYQNFNGKKYLSDLFGMNYIPVYGEQEVRIDVLKKDILQLFVIENSKEVLLYEINAKNDEYECIDGTIHFNGLRKNYFHAFVTATSRAEIKLNAGEDGSLIAEIRHESFTLGFFVMPIFSNKVVWSKWNKID